MAGKQSGYIGENIRGRIDEGWNVWGMWRKSCRVWICPEKASGECQDSRAGLQSLSAAVMICATLVNARAHTHTFWPAILLAQLAELKTKGTVLSDSKIVFVLTGFCSDGLFQDSKHETYTLTKFVRGRIISGGFWPFLSATALTHRRSTSPCSAESWGRRIKRTLVDVYRRQLSVSVVSWPQRLLKHW